MDRNSAAGKLRKASECGKDWLPQKACGKESWEVCSRDWPLPAASVPRPPHLQLCDAHLMIDLLLVPPLVLGHCDVGQLYLQLQHLPHLLPCGRGPSAQQYPQLLHVVQVGSKDLSKP